MIVVSFYKLGAFFARRLPEHLSESITQGLVRVQYLLRFRSRRVVLHNLRVALGGDTAPNELRAIRKRVFSNFGRSIYYFLRLPFIDVKELQERCDYNGIEEVLQELTADGGFILAGPHLGPWEVGAACLTALGIPIQTVFLPHPSKHVTRFFNERRRLIGVECTPLGRSSRALRQTLHGGRAVALLVDRVYGGSNGTFRWFGREVQLPFGHALLAVRCQVPIVMTACVFDGEHGFKFVFNGPHYPRTDTSSREAMNELQEQCMRDMETFIRQYPDQWFRFFPFGGTHVDA